jgi:hypothetical protein
MKYVPYYYHKTLKTNQNRLLGMAATQPCAAGSCQLASFPNRFEGFVSFVTKRKQQ